MRASTDRTRVIALLSAVLLSAGPCATASASAAPDGKAFGHGPVSRPATSGSGLLYEGAAINAPGEVYIYRQGGRHQRVGKITQGIDDPFGLFVDSALNLYVANILNGTVTVYARGSKTPFETLTGMGAPEQVVVGLDGWVYVSDMGTTDNQHTNAAVYAFAPGSTKSTRTVATFSHGDWPLGLGLDSANNLYVAFNHPSSRLRPQGAVREFAPGSSSGKDLGILLGQAGGLAVDAHDNLLIVDELANSVDVFPPGHSQFSKQYILHRQCCIYNLALNRANDEIWVTAGFWGNVYGISYPGGQVRDTISRHTGWAWGVATSPEGSP